MLDLKILAATDLHCVENLYLELAAAVDEHRPDVVALVGDFLDALGSEHKQLTTANCAKALAELPCKNIIFTRGNHEYDNWWEFEGAWATTGRKMHALHGEAFVANPLVAVGFPCDLGDETAFVGNRKRLPFPPRQWLSSLLRQHSPGMRTLWLMHEPPRGTPLTVRSGPVSGNHLWNEAIERFSPWLVISGHDHGTPVRTGKWYARVGQSLAFSFANHGLSRRPEAFATRLGCGNVKSQMGADYLGSEGCRFKSCCVDHTNSRLA